MRLAPACVQNSVPGRPRILEDMRDAVPGDWRTVLGPALRAESFGDLERWVAGQRASFEVYPSEERVFAALELTPLAAVRAVILGQDPYHQPDQADGLAFSVRAGVPPPPSLRTILAELDPALRPARSGDGSLEPWARRGVLLLNTVLTVRRDAPGSHSRRGWEEFTDAVVRAVADKPDPIVFLLWGAKAQGKRSLMVADHHIVLASSHPSPRSAWRDFVGSRPFQRANAELERRGHSPIEWDLSGTGR